MFVRCLIPFALIITVFKAGIAKADAAAGAQAVSIFMDKMDEAAGVGFAVSDLLEDLGLENDNEEQLEKAVSELESINSKIRDARWTHDEFKQITDYDLKRGRSLTTKIKALSRLIDWSKKVASVAGVRPKAADAALKVQQIKIDSMILEELQSMRRTQYLAHLENQKYKTDRELYLNEILEQERGKSYGLKRRRIQ